jgi:hypothetical protein
MTAPITLTRADRERLAKIAGMLGSAHDGERAAAALKATKLLSGLGLNWPELIALVPVKPEATVHFMTRPETRRAAQGTGIRPEPFTLLRRWQKTARMVAAYPDMLNQRELDFVQDIAVRRDEPTVKQTDWLNNLAARVESRRAA